MHVFRFIFILLFYVSASKINGDVILKCYLVKKISTILFTFKNKKYDKDRKYYLVAYDESNDVEVFRHEVIMDLAFSDNFGFDL